MKTNLDNGIDALLNAIEELKIAQNCFEQEYGFLNGQIQGATLFTETAIRIFKGIE